MPSPTDTLILAELVAIHEKLDEMLPLLKCIERCEYTMALHAQGGEEAELHEPAAP